MCAKKKKAKTGNFKALIFKSWYNKYLLSMVVFGIWMIFFDKNNMVNQFRLAQKLDGLKKEQIDYNDKLKLAEQEREDLRHNKERYAREKYFAKKDNEEVFIIERK